MYKLFCIRKCFFFSTCNFSIRYFYKFTTLYSQPRSLCNLTFERNWIKAAAAAAKSLQLCPTLCDPIEGSPPGSLVPGILQARTLEWVAISFSNSWKWKVKVKSFIHVWFLATPWTATYQAPPSMKFSRQEYWSGVPLPSPLCSLMPLKCTNFSHWSISWFTG